MDLTSIKPMLAELTAVLRKYGYAIDIGDGELHLYPLEHVHRKSVAALRWDNKKGLVASELDS